MVRQWRRRSGLAVATAALIVLGNPASAAPAQPGVVRAHGHGHGPAATDASGARTARLAPRTTTPTGARNELLAKTLFEEDDEQGPETNLTALCATELGQPNPYA